MKTIDVIKVMENEKKCEEKSIENEESRKYNKKINKYYNDYIHYNLVSLIDDFDTNSKDESIKNKSIDIKYYAIRAIQIINNGNEKPPIPKNSSEEEKQFAKLLEDIYKDNEDFYIYQSLGDLIGKKGNDELSLIDTKDVNFKKAIATEICQMLLMRCENKKIFDFYKSHIVPKLNELLKADIIDFDVTKQDEKNQKIKHNIIHSVITFIADIRALAYKTKKDNKELLEFLNFLDGSDDMKDGVAVFFIDKFLEIYYSQHFQDYLSSNKNGIFEIHLIGEENKTDDIIDLKIGEMISLYIIPALNELDKKGIFHFDINSTNKKLNKISNNVLIFIHKLIISLVEEYNNQEQNKELNFVEYLFLDPTDENTEKKEIFCNIILDIFLNNFKTLDFENDDIVDLKVKRVPKNDKSNNTDN